MDERKKYHNIFILQMVALAFGIDLFNQHQPNVQQNRNELNNLYASMPHLSVDMCDVYVAIFKRKCNIFPPLHFIYMRVYLEKSSERSLLPKNETIPCNIYTCRHGRTPCHIGYKISLKLAFRLHAHMVHIEKKKNLRYWLQL